MISQGLISSDTKHMRYFAIAYLLLGLVCCLAMVCALLDDRTTLERYSLDQLHELHIAVRGKTFHCGGYSPSTIPENNPHDGCGHHFTFLEATGKKDERTAMLREFFDL